MRLAILLCSCFAVQAQQNPEIKVNVENFRYPVLALSARIQGDVSFEIAASEQILVSAHPLLVQAAEKNIATWGLPRLEDGKYMIQYHFAIYPLRN